jgi:hypothetical protein
MDDLADQMDVPWWNLTEAEWGEAERLDAGDIEDPPEKTNKDSSV